MARGKALPKRGRASSRPEVSNRLASGGVFGFWIDEGHYEVTQDAAERFGFSSAGVDILRDASQDPDFYEFTVPAAHSQSDDAVGMIAPGPARERAEQDAIARYKDWVAGCVSKLRGAAGERPRDALYWLGYALHGVEDLAPHGGITNAEHASLAESPDDDENNIALAGHYAFEFLRNIREFLGPEAFDRLRSWDGEGHLSHAEKVALLGRDHDISLPEWQKYKEGGKAYDAKKQVPVRWPRERVFTEIVEALSALVQKLATRKKPAAAAAAGALGFESLGPAVAGRSPAEWTVMVFMAGDDANPNGIEYAINQDLGEIKRVGSTESVHFLVQTDGYRQQNCYRYRLRRETSLEADRLGLYRGDLNTGKVSTITDFVSWCQSSFPARRYALILWGHGSGHDDQDIYRLGRGNLSPRLAARLASRNLGFFGRTRRAMVERQGPNKGYGFDSSAADFLDNRELKKALAAVKRILGRPLDLLGFDACLMANMEVAYQIGRYAKFLVASEQMEPGDGWSYQEAFRGLPAKPAMEPKALGAAIVHAYRKAYKSQQTLSAVDQGRIAGLGKDLKAFADALGKNPSLFHEAQVAAMNFSPEGTEGYRDLGAFLAAVRDRDRGAPARAAKKALASYREAIVAAAGAGTGLTVYLPGNYRPYRPGGTDALYQLMDFPMQCGWSGLLATVYRSHSREATAAGHRGPGVQARYGSLFGLDRHNAEEILRALRQRSSDRHWMDLMRRELMPLPAGSWPELLEKAGSAPKVRIFILPGIMGSQLSDRSGQNGLLWIDPVGLTLGSDYDRLRRTPDGRGDSDPAVRIEAAGPVPVIYDRLALSLLAAFGRCVDYLAFDWRVPIAELGRRTARRISLQMAGDAESPVVLVGHSMGGLVAAKALESLKACDPLLHGRVRGLVTMGTPWQGSFKPVLVMAGRDPSLRLFSRLTNRTPEETAAVPQTFWGLTDMIPPSHPELLDPRLYAPGPVASSPCGAEQMSSPLGLEMKPPDNTLALVCDTQTTVTDLRYAGGAWEEEMGPGDGTVPLWSAVPKDPKGKLEIAVVDEGHMTMPLNGVAIGKVLERIGSWTGLAARTAPAFTAAPRCTMPSPDRASLMEAMERMDETPLSLGFLKTLMFLA